MAMRDLRSLPPNPIPRGARLHFAQTHGLGTGESHEHGTDEPTKGCGCRGRPRLQLMEKNAAVVLSVVKEVLARNTGAVLLVATNPVDVMTYVALQCTGWDKGRIVESKLAPQKHRQLSASATAIKKAIGQLGSAGSSFS